MKRSEWLEERRTGIGSSDIASLLGIDSFGRTPIDVWLSKVKPDWKREESPILAQGLALEPVVAKEYANQTKRRLKEVKHEIFRHPKYPEIIATPDRLVPSERRFVELKVEFFGHNKFGQAGSDQVPDNYLAQVAHQYAVLDYEHADIARLRAGRETEIFPIARDREIEEMIVSAAREFWHGYVVSKIEPPIDYGATWAQYLAVKFPKDTGSMVAVDDEATIKKILELADLKSEIAALEKHQSELESHVKAAIGENTGLVGAWGKVTWKRSKDKTEDVVDWQDVAEQMAIERFDRERFREIVKTYTTPGVVVRAGSRRLILDVKENP